MLLHKKIFEFKKDALKTNEEIENIFNNNEYELLKTGIQLIEKDVTDSIVNNKKIEYPKDDYFPMPQNAAEMEKEIKEE